MKTKRITALFVVIAMLLSLSVNSAFAVTGVPEAPYYNAATNVYEISKPEQLMYISGDWKDGAPLDGHYVLTADIDMQGYTGFKPIASQKERGFLGTFDGQYHVIKNLVINYPKKYVGLFGYIGNEDVKAYVKNVALVNCDILGQQNVGGIVGVDYGTITNCYVSGKIRVEDMSNSHTGGGIAGKVKEGEGPVMGHVENCYTDVQMEAPYDVGGIAGLQDGGGYVGHSFAAGTVNAYGPNGAAGGIAGSFNAGDQIVGCVSAQTSITGTINSDKIVGQLDDEPASNITNNIAWEGTLLAGNEPVFQPIHWEDVSSTALCQKATYTALGWDFNDSWEWVGDDNNGYVKLKGFAGSLFQQRDWSFTGTRIISRAVNETPLGTAATINARVLSSDTIQSVELYYGNSVDGSTFTDHVPMTLSGDNYVGAVPATTAGMIYYYIKVVTDTETITKPYSVSQAIDIYVDDGTIHGEPSQITMVPDTEQGGMRFSWVTVPQVTVTVMEYKIEGASSWQTQAGTSYIDAVTPGWKELCTHRVVLEDLEPDATYVYRVGDGQTFMSEEHTFRAPSDSDDEFSFIFVTDPQAITTDDYMSFKKSLDYATTILPDPAFIMSAGDTVQDGYKSTEWASCFEVMGDYFASIPTIITPGNHEMKGDWGFTAFRQRFNLPGGDTQTGFDDTIGCIEYGDACIVVINTEVTPPTDKPEIIRKQLEWAKECYEESDKKWRIMLAHAGPYTSNHDPLEIRDYFVNDSEYSIDALKVDLFLNGHDHLYIRSTVKNDIKVNTGDGTTYVTGGTVGNKYYEYRSDRSDYSTTAYYDDEDRQIFTIFTVSDDSIVGQAYQCDNDDTDEKEELESWDDWTIRDSYEIRNSLEDEKEISDYTDVEESDWFYEGAEFVVEEQLIQGQEAYVFGGAEALTRADVAAAFYNLAEQPAYTLTTDFSDVDGRNPRKQAISWVTANGIMSGADTGIFAPDATMTREQFVTVLLNYLEIFNNDDADDNDDDMDDILCHPDSTLTPQSPITRAEASAIFQNIFD